MFGDLVAFDTGDAIRVNKILEPFQTNIIIWKLFAKGLEVYLIIWGLFLLAFIVFTSNLPTMIAYYLPTVKG